MPTGSPANATWQKWHDELELAKKAKGYKSWQTRAKKIIRRYRDERGDLDGVSDGMQPDQSGARFNILWSNVQTLQPALFAKSPKPVVERRYLDRDDVGRTASVILERALLYELDNGIYLSAIRKAVLDRLLPGRGVVWVRYEPKFSAVPQKTQVAPDGVDKEADASAQKDEAKESGGLTEEVAYECAPVDYVDWCDFGTSPSRTWEEVWYIWKRVYMTRKELTDRFGEKIGKEIPLDWSPNQDMKSAPGTSPVTGVSGDDQKRAKILEIWDKTERKVYWMAESWSDELLDQKDDPLNLEGFWPVPRPLFATLTNESLVPVPDYHEYQDQAIELDDLTARISSLTKAIKAAGVYDASVPELQRMFEEGFENRLVPCDNMAEFSQKAGANGMGHIWMLPVKDLAFVLMELYKARDQVKQSLYEITGISDIVRGQATGGGATATEQRIKGQFASMRLNDMQAEVARFCRDTLRIMGEIIAEHYDPMTLYLVSGYEQYAKEQFPPEPPKPQMMGHNGGPPMDSPQASPMAAAGAPGPTPLPVGAGMQPIMLPPDPVQVAQQKAADMFKRAVELLRNDKLRGFRIDIETDSLIEPDQQATQQARTELLGAISQFLPQAIEAGSAVPELKPLMARLLMFFLRGFKASRDIESAFEQFIDDVTKAAANPQPKPPSPEEIKAQAEMAKQKAETERMQLQQQIDTQKGQQEMAALQAKMQMEQQRQEMEFMHAQRMLQLKEREAMLKIGVTQQQAQIDAESQERQAAIDERGAVRDEAMADRAAERDEETAETQAAIAVKTAKAKANKPEARA
jgi:hypothetical protein